MRKTTARLTMLTLFYAAAIYVASSVDLSYEWRAQVGSPEVVTRGFGLGSGYVGIWELGSESAGLRARVHRLDFGFAGVTLIARAARDRVFLIAPWSILVGAWVMHLFWFLFHGRRDAVQHGVAPDGRSPAAPARR